MVLVDRLLLWPFRARRTRLNQLYRDMVFTRFLMASNSHRLDGSLLLPRPSVQVRLIPKIGRPRMVLAVEVVPVLHPYGSRGLYFFDFLI